MIINNLSVTFQDRILLKKVSLAIEPGSLHVLMGPNGSGKSTLAATLMGHPRYQITQGSITFDGVDITTLSADKRARLGIFLAFQQPYELPGVTVFAFLKEAYQARTGKIIDVAEFRTLLHQACACVGLDTSFESRSVNDGFSGGEKKKLEVVQMLMLQPELVILDEIDSGLDSDALNYVAHAIETLRLKNPRTAYLVITHYHRIFASLNPDRVHVLIDGVCVQSGSAELALAIERDGYQSLRSAGL